MVTTCQLTGYPALKTQVINVAAIRLQHVREAEIVHLVMTAAVPIINWIAVKIILPKIPMKQAVSAIPIPIPQPHVRKTAVVIFVLEATMLAIINSPAYLVSFNRHPAVLKIIIPTIL